MGDVLHVGAQGVREDVAARAAADMLLAGCVLVMPTDSVYGIGCAAMSGNPAHGRIFEIKHRERTQTLPLLVADVRDLHIFGTDLPDYAAALAKRFWPGALTLVVRASEAVPLEYRAANGTVALRCPDCELVRDTIRRISVPLATTSANTHGEASPTSGASVELRIVEQADLTLDAGPAPVGVASTIIDCTGPAPHVLRAGAIPESRLLS